MNKSVKILSEITVFAKYAKYDKKKQRRETWEEICYRNMAMNLNKYPQLYQEILDVYHNFVIPKKVLPSMRSMQFGGRPIELSPNRVFNCCFLPVDHYKTFSETMFLLLGGSGVGYSVQKAHISKLPEINKPTKKRRYVVGDSIVGWSDAVKALMEAYFRGKSLPVFDFSDVRAKGAELITSGGKAPGPEPLKTCLFKIQTILDRKENGTKLSTLEVNDIVCFIADAVLTGGIRRAALICLFDLDDNDMLTCKFGEWYIENPQRGRANNSAVVMRHKVSENDFMELWKKIEASGSGEPGIYFSNNADWGTNPSLRAGTRVYTTDGIFPIEELQDKEFFVKNLNGEVSPAKCWLSGKSKQLHKITLTGGHEYYATPEHEWAVQDSSGSFTKVRTDLLKAGQKFPILRESKMFDGTLGNYKDGFFIGWQLGDGGTHLRKDSGLIQHNLIVSEKDSESGIKETLQSYINEQLGLDCNFRERNGNFEVNTCAKSWNNLQESFGYSTKEMGLPRSVWVGGTEEFRKGIIDGVFSSDGHIEKNKKRISFCSKHEKFAKDVSDLLGFYGIKNAVSSSTSEEGFTRFNVRITENRSILQFKKLFKLSNKYKQDTLDSYQFPYGVKEDNTVVITSVELSDIREDVWDISVKDATHCFQIAQCITGNCCEIALRPNQFCNLTEINASDIIDQADLEARSRAAAFLGTLQAGYTDFHYLRDIWKKQTEKDALIGVGMTGIASGAVLALDLTKAAEAVKEENERIANIIGINVAARTTCVKPSGTTSLVVGSSSGIHAWHSEYYIRNIRFGKNEAIYKYLTENHPELVQDEYFKPESQAVVGIPVKAPEGSIFRTESAIDLLERVKKFSSEWIKPGHRKGDNTHNVSATVTIKPEEWESVGKWMWENRSVYNGLAVLPFSDHSYIQAPFQDCTKAEYEALYAVLTSVDLTKIQELSDTTDLKNEAACSGPNGCEV